MPILQCLGKALLDGGAAAEAEAVYRNDLRVYPENGWGLTGLAQAMEAQGKPAADVAAVRARLAEAWSAADVPLPPSSCAAFEFDVPLPARASSPSCTAGATIAHSNITAAAPCVGAEGDECALNEAAFRKACKQFSEKEERRIRMCRSVLEEMGKLCEELALYFGEDSKRYDVTKAFETLGQFSKLYERSLNKLVEKRERQERMARRAANPSNFFRRRSSKKS